MGPLYVSSGAFIGRVNRRDPRPFLASAHSLDADGIEFMMYEAWYPHLAEILPLFQRTGLAFPVLHVEKNIGGIVGEGNEGATKEALSRFEANCRAAIALGSTTLVFHLWNGLVSDTHIERNLAIYDKIKRIAEDYGLLLTVENVVCAVSSPLAHFSSLTALDSNVKFTFDTKMANFHRELPLVTDGIFDPLLKGRITHVHLNDHCGKYHDFASIRTRHLGEGMIDFAPFLTYMQRYLPNTAVTLECTSMREDGTLDFAAMQRSRALARGWLRGGVYADDALMAASAEGRQG